MLRDGPPLIAKVYVVVAEGVTCLVPRGVTDPIPGSMLTPDGFSVRHTNNTGCPGRTAAGLASNETIRGSKPG